MNKNKNTISRRAVLSSASAIGLAALGGVGGTALARIAESAALASNARQAFTTLTAREAALIDAITARLIPTTDTPGAREAGVVHFFDQALGRELANALATIRTGLADIDAATTLAYPEASGFLDLPDSAQDAMLHNIETSIFFRTVLVITKWGFFAMAKYGGNHEHVSWKLVGYDGHHGAWQYPFGYYDAKVHGDN